MFCFFMTDKTTEENEAVLQILVYVRFCYVSGFVGGVSSFILKRPVPCVFPLILLPVLILSTCVPRHL